MSEKGGVGKTTCTMNTAAVVYDALVQPEPLFQETVELTGDPTSPVLVTDTDPQGSALWWSKRAEAAGGLPFDFAHASSVVEITSLPGQPYQHIFVDTAGNLETTGTTGAVLNAVLDVCDDIVVPMTPDPLCFGPTAETIETLLIPRGLPFRIVINGWEPRDGDDDLLETKRFVMKNRWPLCRTVIRRYKLHKNAAVDGLVVTQYPRNRVALQAREDFYRHALELGYGGTSSTPMTAPAAVTTSEV